MNEKKLKYAIDHLAEELVPAEVDLWPSIQVCLKTSKSHSPKGDLSAHRNLARSRRFRLVVLSLSVLFIVAVVGFFNCPAPKSCRSGSAGLLCENKGYPGTCNPHSRRNAKSSRGTRPRPGRPAAVAGYRAAEKPANQPGSRLPDQAAGVASGGLENGTHPDGDERKCLGQFRLRAGRQPDVPDHQPCPRYGWDYSGPEGKVETITMGKITAEYVHGSG